MEISTNSSVLQQEYTPLEILDKLNVVATSSMIKATTRTSMASITHP